MGAFWPSSCCDFLDELLDKVIEFLFLRELNFHKLSAAGKRKVS
ncbi:hypothetical protein HMPREF0297_0149 [Corynebacterium jeikeium ATCC 43734]|nr:hypothetical protein HMPREF0297_0149 [Corynebacterium jeikeium ATCC 43734]